MDNLAHFKGAIKSWKLRLVLCEPSKMIVKGKHSKEQRLEFNVS